MILSSTLTFGNQDTIVPNDSKFYIRDYAPKIYGKLPLTIVETKDGFVIMHIYTIYYNKEKIIKIKKHINKTKYTYKKLDNGNILLSNGSEYYSEKYFSDKTHFPNFYKLVFPKFLYCSNKEKYITIEKLCQDLNKNKGQ